MKMWSVNVIILLLFCYACLSTGNGKVYFVSKNFYNVLHWDPEEPTSPGEKVLYSVEYKSYTAEQYQIKEECQNITALTCDLTAETPSDPYVYYMAQVFVNDRFLGRIANRLSPIADTTFGPPTLSIKTTVSSLYIDVTLPLGPNGVSIADIISRSKNGPSKTVPVYTLKITEPAWATLTKHNTTGRFAVINLKNNQTKYCGHVSYKPSAEWGRRESQKEHFCVTLPGDTRMLLSWLLTSAVLLAVIVTVSVVWTCNYMKGGKQNDMPQSLVPPSGTPCRVMKTPDRHIMISKAVVNTPSDQTVYATIQVKPNFPSVSTGGYSPQDIPWQDSTESSVGTGTHNPNPNPQDTSTQSSEIYSAVAVQVCTVESEDFQPSTTEDREMRNLPPTTSTGEPWKKCGVTPNLKTCVVPPVADQDACESSPAGPLLLHTVRDPNGQLVLPSLTLLQRNTGDTVSPLNPERKPLLTDLIDSKNEGPSLVSLRSFDSSEWSDSGCDDSTVNTPTQPYCHTHYNPSQPVVSGYHRQCQDTPTSDATFDSGYKRNWMPAVFHEAASKYSCEYRRTNYPWTWTVPKEEEESEGDEDRGREDRSTQFLLGGWMLQIQE
ncbi:interferon lambda receptor 1 [Lates calcarifer]|uniref:Interferon lambda receptor 1 n=1 Tax=Lates calcarifer TaxID=8187 RepID=A0A4W6C755_LATCA|nr:interferon lambda receptor 1 [Lates calcarifer]